jgi:hypothetical protein
MNIYALGLSAWARGIVVLLLIMPGSVMSAKKWPLLGPLQTRNLSPFSLLRMDFMPPPNAAGQQRGWGVDARLTHANTFVKSGNVEAYLNARQTRGALAEEDVRALFAREGDVLYFDGTITSLDLTASYVHEKHWMGYVNLPLLYYSGGILDGAIEGFHKTFGYDAAERDLVARDRYQTIIRHSGDRLVLLDAPSGVQVGDPVVGVRFSNEFANQAFAMIEGAVKVPVGDVDNYVSSGALDYGIQLTLQKQLGRHGFYLSLSNQWLGDAERFPSAVRGEVPEATVAYEFGFTRHTMAVLQTSWSKTAFKSGTNPLSTDEFLASVGLRHWRGTIAYDFSLTENYSNYDNTLDVAATLGVTWMLPNNPVN